jgi:hypothetical protein
MNTHYGQRDDLPFDLKHRRWPVCFELAPDATKPQCEKVMKGLARKFAGILKRYLENPQPGKILERIPATTNAATYWKDGELLVQSTSRRGHDKALELVYAQDQPLIYLRIWPDAPLKELSGRELT